MKKMNQPNPRSLSRIFVVFALAFVLLPGSSGLARAASFEAPSDPLGSVMWKQMYDTFLDGGTRKVVFDKNVLVKTSVNVEDQFQVPVTVDARGLSGVRKIVVFSDLNPIWHVLTYQPLQAEPYISFRFKVQQSTPIRAAVLTRDNVWHIAGVNLEAAGGGCTSPAMAHGLPDWTLRLAEVRARIWRSLDNRETRLRLRIEHPMDTGLADGIPPFFIENLDIKSADGRIFGHLQIHEPVSENPAFTLMPKLKPSDSSVIVDGRDIEGNNIRAVVPASARASGLEMPAGSHVNGTTMR